MSGPWEKYAPAQKTSGPWDKYAAPIEAESAPSLKDEDLPQSMPEDVSSYHRFVVKNFGNSPEASVKYLQERYPQYSVSASKKNIVFADPNNGKPAGVLDPQTGIFHGNLGENLMDLTDIGTDVGSGALSTAASGAAGLAAAPTAVGALPAAAGAGALTSAGLEGLRQKLGQYLGIPQEVSGKDVAISGALGAATPILMGTGATAAGVAKTAAARGLTAEAAKDLAASQKGLIMRGASKVGSVFSGIPKETIDSASQNLGRVKDLENSKIPTKELAKGVIEDIGKVEDAKTAIGKNIQNAVEAHPSPINLSSAKAPYLEEIQRLENLKVKEGLTPAMEDDLQALKSRFNYLFGEGSPEAASASKAFITKGKLADEANLNMGAGADTRDLTEKLIQSTARRGGKNLSGEFTQSIPTLEENNPKYSAITNLLNSLDPKAESEKKAYNFIRGIGKPSEQVTSEDLKLLDDSLGTKFENQANLTKAFETFRKSRPFKFGYEQIKQRAPAEAIGGTLGAYEGSKEGGGWGGGILGGFSGAAAGATASSPAAIRFYLEGLNKAAPAAPYLRQGALPLWNLIHSRSEQKK